ncbi:hypothetical protein MHI32_16120 [Paenibacillus sp. FSL H7-0690]|uniref:hypothetical protein n=1 Tax=Paenibacillus sp. FSL H7-0690 TaxID=2921437 RepID=UPI0030EC2874
MKHRGHFGVSMGTIIKKKTKVEPQDKHCSNCRFFYKGICKKIAEVSEGKQLYISNKTAAKRCVHYINRHSEKKSKSSNEKKRNTRPKTEKTKKMTKTIKAAETVKELTIHEIVDIEISRFNKMRERAQRYVSPFLFECKYDIRKVLNVRGNDQVEYRVFSGEDTGKTKICNVNKFKNEVITIKNIQKDGL